MLNLLYALLALLFSILFLCIIYAFIVWAFSFSDPTKSLEEEFGTKFWESTKFWRKLLKSLLIVSVPLGAGVYWEINYFGETSVFSLIAYMVWGNVGIIILCLLIELLLRKIKNFYNYLFKK
jgi:hypothetical protein